MRNVSCSMIALLFAAACGVDTPEDAPGRTDDTADEIAARAAAGSEPKRHCLVRMEPGDIAGPAKVGAMTCYGSISEVVRAATDGRVALPATTRASELDDALLREAGYDAVAPSLASVLVGIDYSEPYYGGATLTWTAPYGCYDPYSGFSYTWFADSMPYGWDNVASSARTFSYCRGTTLYSDVYRTGFGMVFGCDAPSLGWMDNNTSSQSWSPYGQCPWF